MSLSKSNHLYFTLYGIILISILPVLQKSTEIRYSQAPTIPFDWDTLQADTVFFWDSLSGQVLNQIKTLEGIPVFYAQEVSMEVCFDQKCRPLNLTIYWNITGRYLGFKLPISEFLSRVDHEPFTAEDYIRLNALLADPHLPLDGILFEELIQPSQALADKVDGFSGATSKDVLEYVVKGAAYTTYTMWNGVYGPMQAIVCRLTEQEMTPALLTMILRSPSSKDKLWGLGKIDGRNLLDPGVEEALLEIINDEDFYVSYSAINAVNSVHLESESLQISLFSKYQGVNHSLRKQILEKLKEAPKISPAVIAKSREILADLNGAQLGYFLELYERHAIEDIEICRSVAGLLDQDNQFISEKAYQYLMDRSVKDDVMIRALKRYEERKREW